MRKRQKIIEKKLRQVDRILKQLHMANTREFRLGQRLQRVVKKVKESTKP